MGARCRRSASGHGDGPRRTGARGRTRAVAHRGLIVATYSRRTPSTCDGRSGAGGTVALAEDYGLAGGSLGRMNRAWRGSNRARGGGSSGVRTAGAYEATGARLWRTYFLVCGAGAGGRPLEDALAASVHALATLHDTGQEPR
jgi:hypothetical protein